MKRRTFNKLAASGISALSIVPRHVLGGKGFVPPSDKLRIAAIGAGGKGIVNITNSFDGGSADIISLCDVDDRMAVEARKIHEKATYYRDYRELLEKEEGNIDAVIISTPDHMHAVMALSAMRMGKHVYVEKPLTHDIYEARILTQAAKKYKVVTQMGNQGSSGDDTRNIRSWIQAGAIGDVHRVHIWTNRPVWPQGIPTPEGDFTIPSELDWDLWLGTAPNRKFNPGYLPATWRGWGEFGTGALGDMGCHFIDVPYMALNLGYPSSVECSVGGVWTGFFQETTYTDSYPPSSKIHLEFSSREGMVPLEMVWYDGGILPKRPAELLPDEKMGEWDGGMIFEGSKGKLMAGLFGREPTLLPTTKMRLADLPQTTLPLVQDGRDGHQHQWVQACMEGYGAYTSSSFDISGPLTETVLMGNLAVRVYNHKEGKDGEFEGRKRLLWDGQNMQITNFEAANQFVKRTYREGYDLIL